MLTFLKTDIIFIFYSKASLYYLNLIMKVKTHYIDISRNWCNIYILYCTIVYSYILFKWIALLFEFDYYFNLTTAVFVTMDAKLKLSIKNKKLFVPEIAISVGIYYLFKKLVSMWRREDTLTKHSVVNSLQYTKIFTCHIIH